MADVIEIKIPDVGGVASIDVVEVLIKPGDAITLEQPIATLETDKASMELPASAEGTVQQVLIKPGDKVKEGSLVATIAVNGADTLKAKPEQPAPPVAKPAIPQPEIEPKATNATVISTPAKISAPVQATTDVSPAKIETGQSVKAHASPSVRLFARELGVDIARISGGSGPKGRILKDDVKSFVKQIMGAGASQGATGIPSIPAIDFSQFGDTETLKLNKIKKLTGQNLSRVWLNLPMVTYHEEADITELEAFRISLNAEKAKNEV